MESPPQRISDCAPGVFQAKPIQKASWGVSFKRVMCVGFLSLFLSLNFWRMCTGLNTSAWQRVKAWNNKPLVFQGFSNTVSEGCFSFFNFFFIKFWTAKMFCFKISQPRERQRFDQKEKKDIAHLCKPAWVSSTADVADCLQTVCLPTSHQGFLSFFITSLFKTNVLT